MKGRLVAVARALLVLVGLSPFAPALLAGAGATRLAEALEAWFRFQCERDPQRMLGAGAVCARCLGLYVGLGLGALLARPRLHARRLELWLGVAALLMLVDVGSEWLGWRAAWAPLRLVTGLLLGYPAGVAVVAGLDARARGTVASAPVTAPDL
ncbi:MAG TPA: DUF2085 domain-containing protein [Polyangiaceae bacterium]|nr:DUF2085 domain-containing protein [Polyangiaceae bacterium]